MKFPIVALCSLLCLACTLACTPSSTGQESTPAKAAANTPAKASSNVFEEKLSLQGVSFQVQCPNQGSINQLTITPTGLEGENPTIVVKIEGTVTNAEIEDLDANGYPEIYVYVQGAGSGSYGRLIAYACNQKKSLSPIFLPDLMEDKVNSKGYMGHDQFAVGEGSLLRRFPLYQQGDTNSKPTGKTRQLQYKLKPGEAGWILRLEKALEY